jgi:hypothetical protein
MHWGKRTTRTILLALLASLPMILYYSFRLPLAQASTEPSVVCAFGRASLNNPKTGRSTEVTFKHEKIPAKFKSILTLQSTDTLEHIAPLVFEPEVGGEFIDCINVELVGRRGNLIFVHTTMGACCQGLRVYGISSKGELTEMFAEGCRFGYKVLYIMGDDTPEIIGAEGDVGVPKVQVTIYQLQGDKFVPVAKKIVSEAHRYSLAGVVDNQ